MQENAFLQRETFEQSYQLGLLESEYALSLKKILVHFVSILGVGLSFPLLLSIFSAKANPLSITFYSVLFGSLIVVIGSAMLFYYYRSYRHLHVYVYTNGLLYRNGNISRVIYWGQIRRVSLGRGYLYIMIQNEIPLSIVLYVSRIGELRARIKQKIANAPNLAHFQHP